MHPRRWQPPKTESPSGVCKRTPAVWSSDDCNAGRPGLTFAPSSGGQSYIDDSLLDPQSISKADCPHGQPKAPAGTYSLDRSQPHRDQRKAGDFTLA